VASVEKRKVLPPFKDWTNADDLKLEEAKLDTVKIFAAVRFCSI